MQVLLDRCVGDRRLVALASERGDGDVHPRRVSPALLDRRQRAVAGDRWTMIDQVHGTAVVAVGTDRPRWPLAGRGDVLVCDASGGRVAVWAADCAPLVLYGRSGVVAVHAGWRGLAAGVLDVAVDVIEVRGDEVIGAVLGPVIHPCCYGFGTRDLDDVAAGVGCRAADIAATTSNGSLALDVPGAVRSALRRRGIDLDVVGPCTGCDDRWFSHRRRGDAGRHAVVAWSDVVEPAAAPADVAPW